MKPVLFLAVSLLAFAGPRRPLPGQAGNDDIEMTASPILDRDDMTQALGADIGPGYVMFRVKVTPKTGKPMHISPDDFTMIVRKDGERAEALDPGQIAGKGVLVVKAASNQPGGYLTETNGPVWGGVTDRTSKDDGKESPLLKALKEKILPDKDSTEPLEGLLYFPIEVKKFKEKDLAIIYKGPGGRLEMEFENPK